MKKFLSILLAVVLCFSVCSVVAFAAGEDIIVSAKGGTAQRGGTIRVPISLDANKGFVTLGLAVAYDSDVLEIVCENHEDGKNCTAKRAPAVEKKVDFQVAEDYDCANSGNNSQYHTVNPYLIQWAYGTVEEDICETGEIAAITFKVKDNAKFGDSKVTVTVDQASGYGSAARTFNTAEVTVTVVCKSHTKDAGTVTKEPTCTETGVKTYKCKDCGAEMSTEKIEATGHSWGNWEGTADAKCGTQGEETRVCANDADHKETRKTNALEHLWDNGTVTKEPTCTDKGVKTFKCTRTDCDGTKTEDVKALGHAYGEWTETTAPKCEVEGEETRVCANNAEHKETRPVEALGHDFDYENGTETKEPTCTEEGEIEYPCLNEGCDEVETEVVDALGHTVDWNIEKEATTTEEGRRTGTCEVCGEELDETIPMLTTTLEGDKLGIIVVDTETGEMADKAADGFKVEAADDEPFSGYVTGDIIEVVPDDEEADTVDGKKVAVGYVISLMDTDLGETVDPDKVITLTIPVSESVLAAYENLVLVGVDENGDDIILDATYADGVFTVTGKYSELLAVAIAGDKIVVEEEEDSTVPGVEEEEKDDETTSPATGDTATAVAFAIVMLAVAGAVLVFTSKKVRA